MIETLLPPGEGLTRDEVSRIVRDLDTQEQIDAFLATVILAEDEDEIIPALLAAQPSEQDGAGFLAGLIGFGIFTLAIRLEGQYQTLTVDVPEGWEDLAYVERLTRSQRAIAGAPRRTIDPDTLAGYRDAIDGHYRDITRGLGEALNDGDIDLGEYHQRMIDTLLEAHTVQRHLGQGPLGSEGEQALRDTLDEQLGYLQSFVDQIANGELSPAQIRDRSGRYGANGGLSFNEGMVFALALLATTEQRFLGACSPHCAPCLEYASFGRVPVGTLPPPRSKCLCSNNCCCTFVFYDFLGQKIGWIA
jgi:hypothetical protein